MKTAILVDGGFYRRRAQIKIGEKSAAERANELDGYCRRHLIEKHQTPHELYRIFYYDCPPMNKKVYHPFLKQQIDFSKSELNVWMTQFLSELKQHRKFALRLGKLADAQACYTLRIDVVKKLCSGKLNLCDLQEKDFMIQVDQKGVDMKIGLDIASLSYKKQVDQIVLISGTVILYLLPNLPGVKVLMLFSILWERQFKEDLFEHIDGLRTCDNRYINSKQQAMESKPDQTAVLQVGEQ